MDNLVKVCCPNCGSKVFKKENEFYKCQSCNNIFYNYSDENRIKLVNAHSYLARYRFDDADDIYSELSEEALAINDIKLYVTAEWGRLLSYFGIIFVKGFSGIESVPTIVKYDKDISSVTELEHYQNIMNSNVSTKIKNEYKAMAENIDKTYKRISPELEKIPSYDVFICTKISSATEANPSNEGLSLDYRRASMLYDTLTKNGIKVFFSDRCCQGVEYDSQIFSALIRSKLLLVLSSRKDYLESAWVESEWRRWLSFISNGDKAKNSLILYIPDSSERVVLPSVLNKSKIQRFNDSLEVINHIEATLGFNKLEEKPKKKEEKANINNDQDYAVLAKKLEEMQSKYNELANIKDEPKKVAEEESKPKANYTSKNTSNKNLEVQKPQIKNESSANEALAREAMKHLEFIYDREHKTATIIKYDNSLEELVIPAEIYNDGVIYHVNNIGNQAFKSSKLLKSITIPNSVTNIEAAAFEYCESLVNINIPDSVTSIGQDAFLNCTSLKDITLPNNLTKISECLFDSCKSLTNVDIPNSVTSIETGAFSGCESLVNISVPNSVTSIESGAFYNCTSLENIIIPNSVTSIGGYAFQSCTSLRDITLPNSVTSIESFEFSFCSRLTNITIPNSVTSIGHNAFQDCTSLRAITIPSSVKKVENDIFKNCTDITINCEHRLRPYGWDTNWHTNKKQVKWNCSKKKWFF